MDEHESTNERTPSTAWTWKRVKVRRPAGGQQAPGAKRRRWHGSLPRNPREPLTIKVSYRGGGECWYEIHARGSMGRFPGITALHDVMRVINQTE